MVIIRIIGGLGNQMFQYAFAKALQIKGYNVKLDISNYNEYSPHGGFQLDKYSVDLETLNSSFLKVYFFKALKKIGIFSKYYVVEKSLRFNSNYFEVNSSCYLEGYFQSEKYFIGIRDVLLNQFKFKINISNYSKNVEALIKSVKHSCSIHIRRGDFGDSKNFNIHGFCDLDYYLKATSKIEEYISDIKYFIFSDDPIWVKSFIDIDNAYFVVADFEKQPHEDIYLMSLCKNNIIANSSFSWWGAWLNENQNKIIIAPKIWFSDKSLQQQSYDIQCDNWIML